MKVKWASIWLLALSVPALAGDEPGAEPADPFASAPSAPAPAAGEKSVKFKDDGKGMVDAQGKSLTVVDFDDAVIEGQVVRPEGFMLQKRSEMGLGSTLELRKEFRDRIRASADTGLLVVPVSP